MPKAELAPRATGFTPELSSLHEADIPDSVPLHVEVFSTAPGQMSWVKFDDLRIFFNTSGVSLPFKVEYEQTVWEDDLASDDVIIVPKGLLSQWHWTEPLDCTIARISEQAIDAILAQTHFKKRRRIYFQDFKVIHSPGLCRLVLELRAMCETYFEGRALTFNTMARSFIILLTSEVDKLLQTKEEEEGASATRLFPEIDESELCSRTVDFVSSEFSSKITVEDMAEYARMSRAHFNRMFKQQSGCSPASYLLRYRVERALHMMKASAASLAQIASECGFYDQSHFSRSFKKLTGHSPRNYQKIVQNSTNIQKL